LASSAAGRQQRGPGDPSGLQTRGALTPVCVWGRRVTHPDSRGRHPISRNTRDVVQLASFPRHLPAQLKPVKAAIQFQGPQAMVYGDARAMPGRPWSGLNVTRPPPIAARETPYLQPGVRIIRSSWDLCRPTGGTHITETLLWRTTIGPRERATSRVLHGTEIQVKWYPRARYVCSVMRCCWYDSGTF